MRSIFDAGVASVVFSRKFHEKPSDYAAKNFKKKFWGLVELSFHTIPTTTTNITTGTSNFKQIASKPITAPLGASPWFFFLNNTIITIDIDEGKLWFQHKT